MFNKENDAVVLQVIAEDAQSALNLWGSDLSEDMAGECAVELLGSWAHLQCFSGVEKEIFSMLDTVIRRDGAKLAEHALRVIDAAGWPEAVAAADEACDEGDPADASHTYRAIELFQQLYDVSLCLFTIERLKLADNLPSLGECYMAVDVEHAPLFNLVANTARAMANAYRDDLALIDAELAAETDLPVGIVEAYDEVCGDGLPEITATDIEELRS